MTWRVCVLGMFSWGRERECVQDMFSLGRAANYTVEA